MRFVGFAYLVDDECLCVCSKHLDIDCDHKSTCFEVLVDLTPILGGNSEIDLPFNVGCLRKLNTSLNGCVVSSKKLESDLKSCVREIGKASSKIKKT